MNDRELKSTLASEFEDKEYAHSYMHQHLLERFATQLYTLRADRGMSQEELARRAGVPQGKISRLECAEVESFTLSTALKLAKALDVAVGLRFEGFSQLIRNVDRASPSDLLVQERSKDVASCRSVNSLLRDVHIAPQLVVTTGAQNLDVGSPVLVGGRAQAFHLTQTAE
jgi:transcriptional regulator with XRE-family HTH domain